MKRLSLLILVLVPSLVVAQVPGVKLAVQDTAVIHDHAPQAGQLAVGKDAVVSIPMVSARADTVVTIDSNGQQVVVNGVPGLATAFRLDGKRLASFRSVFAGQAVTVASEHVYVATGGFGLYVLDGKGNEIQNLSGPRMNEIIRLASTPDGKYVFTLHSWAPARVTVYGRDEKSGKLTKVQAFESDEESMTVARENEKRSPPGAMKIIMDKAATPVPNFEIAKDMRMSSDGKYLAVGCYSSSVIVLGPGEKGWKIITTIGEDKQREKLGLHFCMSVLPLDKSIFVGGENRLAWLDFDGKAIKGKTFLVDDGEPPGHTYETVPFLDNVISISASKNGKYLFVVGQDDGSVTVLKVGDGELELVGKLNDSIDACETATSGDRLFVKTTKCQLLVYDLDERFTK